LEIIGIIIFGAVIGVLARVVLPGRQAYGWIVTILLGIGGALIGYWLWGALGRHRHRRHRLDPLGDQHRRRGPAQLPTPG
jgi:uncharacterized membrane protein YeaQ/YmgE (transglycosylase-associated protein family)